MTDEQILNVLADQLLRIKQEVLAKQTQYIFTKVSKINNNKYFAIINGNEYMVPNAANMNFKAGDSIIICIPYNDMKKRFILAKYEK